MFDNETGEKVQVDHKKLFQEVMEARRTIRELRQDNTTLHTENDMLHAGNAALSQQLAVAIGKEVDSRSSRGEPEDRVRIRHQQSTINSLRRQLEDMTFQRDNLNQRLINAYKENNRLRCSRHLIDGPKAWPDCAVTG